MIHFGFSYVGLVFLLMLMIPNMLWTKHQPKDYEKYVVNERKSFLLLAAVVILGIGHIGIHLDHKKEVDKETYEKDVTIK